MTFFGLNNVDWPYFESNENFIYKNLVKTNSEIQKIDTNKCIEMVLGDQCQPTKYANQNKKLLLTDNTIVDNLLDSKYFQQTKPSLYATYGGRVPIKNILPDRDFNCFIRRMDVIRQSWLYQLVRRNLFDRGYISFNMDVIRHKLLGLYPESATAIEIFEDQYQQNLRIFEPEHNLIKCQIPYRNFDQDLNTVILRSRFSIIVETFSSCNDAVTVTEKTFRALRLPRPWLVFGVKHAVKYVRDLGFDVLDDIVDHSYDNIDFSIERQVAILDQAEQLVNLKFTDQLIQRLNQSALHNQEIFETMQQTFHADFLETLVEAKEKCLNL